MSRIDQISAVSLFGGLPEDQIRELADIAVDVEGRDGGDALGGCGGTPARPEQRSQEDGRKAHGQPAGTTRDGRVSHGYTPVTGGRGLAERVGFEPTIRF